VLMTLHGHAFTSASRRLARAVVVVPLSVAAVALDLLWLLRAWIGPLARSLANALFPASALRAALSSLETAAGG